MERRRGGALMYYVGSSVCGALYMCAISTAHMRSVRTRRLHALTLECRSANVLGICTHGLEDSRNPVVRCVWSSQFGSRAHRREGELVGEETFYIVTNRQEYPIIQKYETSTQTESFLFFVLVAPVSKVVVCVCIMLGRTRYRLATF